MAVLIMVNYILTNANNSELNEYKKQCEFKVVSAPFPMNLFYKGIEVDDVNFPKLVPLFKYALTNKIGNDNVVNLLTNSAQLDDMLVQCLGECWLMDTHTGERVLSFFK
jgi:hypothetical protein